MNATELFLSDGRSAKIYFCGECRLVKRTESDAEECCKPYECTYCGVDVPRENFRTACPDCIAKNREKKEAEKFEAAEKVADWDGWIYAEGCGPEFFSDVYELREWFEVEGDEDGAEMPAYVWTCDPSHFAEISLRMVKDLIENDGDAYEDFEADSLDGLDELEKAIEAFNAANKSVLSWVPNFRRALVLEFDRKEES